MCFTNMLLWFNFFLLLRYLEQTAYHVQMIIEVFKDIKVFLVILVMSIFAFTSSFYAIIDQDDKSDVHNFKDILVTVIVMTVGEPDTNLIEKNQLALIIFILTALFNLIVMLNLLIAIVTETYERVKTDKYKFLFRLKVEIIASLQALQSAKTLKPGDPTKLLFFAQVDKKHKELKQGMNEQS